MVLASSLAAQTLRVATFHADLTRRGPGLLLRDITDGTDPQVQAALAVIAQARPDVLLLTGFDHDLEAVALRAFVQALEGAGVPFAHFYAPPQNAGQMTAQDLDGDGRRGGPEDAQGYGKFSGVRSMALLSRFPVTGAKDYSGFLWADLPGSLMPGDDAQVRAVQRLSTTGHWRVQLDIGGKTAEVLAWSATPPLFGNGPRNMLRNHDEAAFWLALLNGKLADAPPDHPFVLMGLANIDPARGEGDRRALSALLAHPALVPGPDAATVYFKSGPMRLSYVLPSQGWQVEDAGVFDPSPGDPVADVVAQASRHRLVWVDLALP